MRVRVPPVPNLPLATQQYERQYQDQLNNVLRLYFNQLNNFAQALAASSGGAVLQFPYIAASGNSSQYASADDTPVKVAWDSADEINGWALDSSGYAAPTSSGVYNIAYSLQFVNTDNAAHEVVVWLRVNNVDLPKSGSKFSLPARKSALVFTYLVAYSSIEFTVNAGDQVELWWATDLHATSGGAAGVYMFAEAAQTSPYAHPSVPAAIGSITFVSALPT